MSALRRNGNAVPGAPNRLEERGGTAWPANGNEQMISASETSWSVSPMRGTELVAFVVEAQQLDNNVVPGGEQILDPGSRSRPKGAGRYRSRTRLSALLLKVWRGWVDQRPKSRGTFAPRQ